MRAKMSTYSEDGLLDHIYEGASAETRDHDYITGQNLRQCGVAVGSDD